MKRILLIDGSNLLFRGYHAIMSHHCKHGATEINEQGEEVLVDVPISVFVISFLQSVKNYVTNFSADEVYVAWDKRLKHPSTNFRKESVNVEYKGNRDPEISKKVYASEEVLTPILRSLGVKIMFPYVLEADDVIAWLSYKLKDDKLTIISVDRDLCQLITNNCVFFDPIRNIKVTTETFEKHLLVPQEHFLKYKALLGDSDNIDGIAGFGKKKALLGALNWDKLDLSDEDKQRVNLFIKLMDLSHGFNVHPEETISYQEQFDQLATHKPDFKQFNLLIEEFKLTPIKYQIEKWRGVFNKSGTIGTTPVNSYLKNLFS